MTNTRIRIKSNIKNMNFDGDLRKYYEKLGVDSIALEARLSHDVPYSKGFARKLAALTGTTIQQKNLRKAESVYILINPDKNTSAVLEKKLKIVDKIKRLKERQQRVIKAQAASIQAASSTTGLAPDPDKAVATAEEDFKKLALASQKQGLGVYWDHFNKYMTPAGTQKQFEIDVYSIYIYNAFEINLNRFHTNIVLVEDMAMQKLGAVQESDKGVAKTTKEVDLGMYDVDSLHLTEDEDRAKHYINQVIIEEGLKDIIKLVTLEDAELLNQEGLTTAMARQMWEGLINRIRQIFFEIPQHLGYGTL